jgi:N-acetylglucosamine kinase-like BadF-type ATPase
LQSLVLGVDGGNTKSIAVVAALDGNVVGAGRSGCGDIYGSSPELALAELDRAMAEALRTAGATLRDVRAAAFSLAGADWPEDFVFLEGEMRRRLGPGVDVLVVNDAIGALRGGSAEPQGVSVVCGTGSAIGARSSGKLWHASFWGEDCGALAMGRKTLRAVARSDLGIDPPTSLTASALATFGVPTVAALLHEVTHRGAPSGSVARLVPGLLDAAQEGDRTGRAIVISVGLTLSTYAHVAADKVGLLGTAFELVLAGGVFRHGGSLLAETVAARLPEARSMRAEFEPAVGALLLALDRSGVTFELDALRRTQPSAAFFVSGDSAWEALATDLRAFDQPSRATPLPAKRS